MIDHPVYGNQSSGVGRTRHVYMRKDACLDSTWTHASTESYLEHLPTHGHSPTKGLSRVTDGESQKLACQGRHDILTAVSVGICRLRDGTDPVTVPKTCGTCYFKIYGKEQPGEAMATTTVGNIQLLN